MIVNICILLLCMTVLDMWGQGDFGQDITRVRIAGGNKKLS